MAIQMPAWLDAMPDEKRPQARTRFLLQIAALHASPEGTLANLSRQLKLNPNTIAVISNYDRLSPELSIKLEKLLGRDLFPRELLRPDIFVAS